MIAPLIWNRLIWNRSNPAPTDPDWGELRTKSRDGTDIFARYLRAGEHCGGTLVLVHGFTINGGMSWFRDWAYQIRAATSLNVILPDLRHHGLSGNAAPSFGTAESWDISACLDYADANQLSRPFYVMGESLGGMAVQRAVVEDPRIAAAVCIHTPGWPWDAIDKGAAWLIGEASANARNPLIKALFQYVSRHGAAFGSLINRHYGFDILSDGDVRNHAPIPPQHPRLLYLIGEEDRFEVGKTRQIWDHFYPDQIAQAQARPADAPGQSKWFISVPGFGHHPMRTVFEWEGFWPLIWEFVRVTEERADV